MPMSPNDVFVHHNELKRARIDMLSDIIDDRIRESAYSAVLEDNSISIRLMFKASIYAKESFTEDEIYEVEKMFEKEWETVKITKLIDTGTMTVYLRNPFRGNSG